MTKKLTIEIVSCSECAHRIVKFTTSDRCASFCTKKRPHQKIETRFEIPDWCPLEDWRSKNG